MLHEAFIQRMEFGREIIFTYGPYGFLTTRMYHPETWPLMLSIWITMSVLFFALTWSIASRRFLSPWITLLFTVVATRVVFVEAMIFLFGFLAIWIATRLNKNTADRADRQSNQQAIADRVKTGLLLAMVGLLPLTKYSFVPATFFLMMVVGVLDVRQRKMPWQSIAVAASMAFFWAASGQPMTGLQNYLVAGFEVASRYVDAMTNWETEAFDIAMVLIAVSLIPLVPSCLRFSAGRQNWIEATMHWGTVATLLFLVFKFTFVGYHGHKLPIYFGSAFLIVLYAYLTKPTADVRSKLILTATGGLFILTVTSAYTRFVETDHSTTSLVTLGNPQHIPAIASWLRGDGWMAERHERNFEDIRQQHPLPALQGTTDVVPDKLAMAIASDKTTFRPRPLLHTYATHSEWLAEQNAAHYRSPDGPDNVLFRINPIVGRFPTLNDGRLWLELIRSFDVTENLGSDLLLCRRIQSRQLAAQQLEPVITTWKTPVSVPKPGNGMIWCRIQIDQTLCGKLAAFAYKLPNIFLNVTQHGQVTKYRITSRSAASGFLLSPVIAEKEDLAHLLAEGRLTQSRDNVGGIDEVETISIETSELSSEYFHNTNIQIEFECITISNDSMLAHDSTNLRTEQH